MARARVSSSAAGLNLCPSRGKKHVSNFTLCSCDVFTSGSAYSLNGTHLSRPPWTRRSGGMRPIFCSSSLAIPPDCSTTAPTCGLSDATARARKPPREKPYTPIRPDEPRLLRNPIDCVVHGLEPGRELFPHSSASGDKGVRLIEVMEQIDAVPGLHETLRGHAHTRPVEDQPARAIET
jgi:hypothetical protein